MTGQQVLTRGGAEILPRSTAWSRIPDRAEDGRWLIPGVPSPMWPEYGVMRPVLAALAADGHIVEELGGPQFERGQQVRVEHLARVQLDADPASYVRDAFDLPDGVSIETIAGSTDIALRDGWVRDYEPYRFRLALHRGPVAAPSVRRFRGGAEYERIATLAATRPDESTVRAVLGSASRPSRAWGRLGPFIATLVAAFRVRQPLGEFELLSPIVRHDNGVVVEGTADWSTLIDVQALGPGVTFEDLGDGWAILRDLPEPYDVLEPVFAIVFRPPLQHFLQRVLGR